MQGTFAPVQAASVGEDLAIELQDGRRLRLAGLEVPGDPASAAREAARGALEAAVAAGGLEAAVVTPEPDRHGRIDALVRQDGAESPGLAARLVDNGLAFAYVSAVSGACGSFLLAGEAAARSARRGFWRHDRFRPLDAGDPASVLSRTGEFALVEGRVLSVGQRPRRTYLNFGTFWNEDFTAYIDAGDTGRIERAGLDIAGLAGRRVRVRGYVVDERGPAIAVSHPGQLELLSPP